MDNKEEKKKIDISKMSYVELLQLFATPGNQSLEINAVTLYITLRAFHKHLIENYVLKEKTKIITPDKSIKDLKGQKV